MDELALASLRLHLESWPEISRLSRGTFGARRVPRLQLAFDADDARGLAAAHERYASTEGFSAELLTAARLRDAEPLAASDAVCGLLTDGNARVDPAPYTRAVVRAAERLGTRVRRGEARQLEADDGHVSAVCLDSGQRLACDGVAIATGPWSEQVEDWLGIPLPVTPVKGELLLVAPRGRRPRAEITWRQVGVYTGPGETLWLGGTEDRAGFDRRVTVSARDAIRAGVDRVLPGLEIAAVLRHVAALRPLAPDGIPIVGRAEGWDNVCLALGSGRKGMLYSAGLGQAVTELLLDGRTALPIDACAPERMAVGA
jgi:glycine oxidase